MRALSLPGLADRGGDGDWSCVWGTVAAGMEGQEGWAWRVKIMRDGYVFGNERMLFPRDTIQAIHGLFNDAAGYMHSGGPHVPPWSFSEQDRVGWVSGVTLEEEDGVLCVYGQLNITKNACGRDLRDMLVDAAERGKMNVVGLSFNIAMRGEYKWMEGPTSLADDTIQENAWFEVSGVDAVYSVDVVGSPAYGDDNGFVGMANINTGDDDEMKKKLIALLRERGVSVDDDIEEGALLGLCAQHLSASANDPPPSIGDDPPNTDDSTAQAIALLRERGVSVDDDIEEGALLGLCAQHLSAPANDPPPTRDDSDLVLELRRDRDSAVFGTMLADSTLPEAFHGEANRQLDAIIANAPSEDDMKAIIENLTELASTVASQHPPLSLPRISTGDDEHEKHVKGMVGLLSGRNEGKVAAFHGLKHAFATLGGSRDGIIDPEDMMREANFMPQMSGLVGQAREQLINAWAAISTTSFGSVLGDAMHRMLIRAYTMDDLMSWKNIVSSEVSVSDFRNQVRARIGGYGILDVVGESAPYQNLRQIDDEDVQAKLLKRGGIEKITFEAFANDDISAIRQIPLNMGRAAGLTLTYDVFNLVTSTGQPVMADGKTAFHADHKNSGTEALSQQAVRAGRAAMQKQNPYGVPEERLAGANDPKCLLTPTDLVNTAEDLSSWAWVVGTEQRNRNAFFNRIEPISVPTWTGDVNDWVLVADPMKQPTIEVGYYMNRREPDILTADTPTSFASLHTDEIELRLRFIFYTLMLDHRGFYLSIVPN